MITTDAKLWGIDLNVVMSNGTLGPVVKQLAERLLKQPYLTLGDYFRDMSDNDLMCLKIMVELSDANDDMVADLIVISQLLAQAEGCAAQSDDESYEHLNYLCMLIASVSLQRRGIVDINWDKLTFGSEFLQEVIITLREE